MDRWHRPKALGCPKRRAFDSCLLTAVASRRPNVHIATGLSVARVVLEAHPTAGALMATGVEVRDVSDAAREQLRALWQSTQRETLVRTAPLWTKFNRQLRETGSGGRTGAALPLRSGLIISDAHEVARKLIMNHVAILGDLTNPEPLTQLDLERVHPSLAEHVDDALREVTRRLLLKDDQEEEEEDGAAAGAAAGATAGAARSRGQGADAHMEQRRTVAAPAPLATAPTLPCAGVAARAWRVAMACFVARLQCSEREEAGRTPDMSIGASMALREVVKEIVKEIVGEVDRKDGGTLSGADSSQRGSADPSGLTSSEASHLPTRTIPLVQGGEVLLTAGAIGSPQLLMLSGIGDPQVLAAAGIDCVHALPGVGLGLQDQPAVTVACHSSPEVSDLVSMLYPYRPWSKLISLARVAEWFLHGTGPLTTSGCDHGAFVRTAPDLALPDVQLRFVPGMGPAADGVKSYELIGKGVNPPSPGGFTFQVIACRPRSLGSIRITCTDPVVAPQISCNYLSNPEDEKSLLRGIRLARQLSQAGTLGAVHSGEVFPGASVQTDEELLEYVRQTLHSANGLSGGCCLGRVVDGELNVLGVQGLRVADASVMPSTPGAQLALPTLMVAERAARMIVSSNPTAK